MIGDANKCSVVLVLIELLKDETKMVRKQVTIELYLYVNGHVDDDK